MSAGVGTSGPYSTERSWTQVRTGEKRREEIRRVKRGEEKGGEGKGEEKRRVKRGEEKGDRGEERRTEHDEREEMRGEEKRRDEK